MAVTPELTLCAHPLKFGACDVLKMLYVSPFFSFLLRRCIVFVRIHVLAGLGYLQPFVELTGFSEILVQWTISMFYQCFM